MFSAYRTLGGIVKEAKKNAEQIAKRANEASEKLYKELEKPEEVRDQNLINSLKLELRGISKEANAIREEMETLANALASLSM